MSNRRLYHLGLDWGTSATKLVLRDYEQGQAYVLYPPGMTLTYRYPSTIAIYRNHLFFGRDAETKRPFRARMYDAIKAEIYKLAKSSNADNDNNDLEDLATLYLSHIISVGFDFASRHASRAKAEALMGMTLGVPAEELASSSIRTIYLRMARTAYEMAIRVGYDPQGRPYDDALLVLNHTRGVLDAKDDGGPSQDSLYIQWLRPELAAAMYWGIKSPRIQPDLYTCVDIGAFTTNASYFRIRSTSGHAPKDGIDFYGGASEPPGVLELLKEIAVQMNQDAFSIIGEEKRYLSQSCSADCIEKFKKKYFKVWEKGFRSAYTKQPKQSAWDGKLNVMVAGGGSKIEQLAQMFYGTCPNKGWRLGQPVPDLGIPTDLYFYPKEGIISQQPYRGDLAFLLVAYGLSVHSGNFPETRLSPQVPPFDPQTRRRVVKSHDELGYDKK